MVTKRGSWRTKFGFYMVAIGSACSLGNLWRFPYIVGENGGGAFVLLYVFLSFTIGASLLIAELQIGKTTKRSVISAIAQIAIKSSQKLSWLGVLPVLVSLTVLSYYSVISGWVLHFMAQFFLALLKGGSANDSALTLLMQSGWLQLMLASAHILIVLVVVVRGVQEGLEKWISLIMPFFAVLVCILLYKSFSLSSSAEALRFLFYPDFSKLTLHSLMHAIGHVFFTLSVGFGTMVTFGSYMREDDHIPTAGFRVASVDTIISLVAAVLIFPVAFQVSDVPLTDPVLLFQSIPRFLGDIRGGTWFGLVFFLCLYLAALNASIGLMEVVISNLRDTYAASKMDRSKAAWTAGCLCLVLSIIPALSSSFFSEVRIGGKSLMESLDSLLINWILPLVALLISRLFVKGFSKQETENSFVSKNFMASTSMYPYWIFVLKWAIPSVIGLGFVLQLIGLIKN